MKLLFVLPEFGSSSLGGLATYYRALLPELVRLGHTVHVMLATPYERAADAQTDGMGVTVSCVDPAALARARESFGAYQIIPGMFEYLSMAQGAWETARGGDQYDLVETTDWGLLFMPWCSNENAAPVVVQCHGSSGQVDFHDPTPGREIEGILCRTLEASLLGKADAVQTYGSSNAREWEALLARPVEHAWPAWLPESPAPESLASEWKPESYMLVVGRIQRWKGAEQLCQAVRAIKSTLPPILWVGRDMPSDVPGQSFGRYLEKTYPDVWGKRVIPLGPQSRGRTAALQNGARCVIVPSTWDVFNYTAIEAMAAERPVICSDGAGASELIRSGENGFVYPAQDTAQCAATIQQALAHNSDESRKIGQAARATVLSELAANRVAHARAQRYSAIAAAGRSVGKKHPWRSLGFRRPGKSADPNDLLGGLALRRIAKYGLARAARKCRGKS